MSPPFVADGQILFYRSGRLPGRKERRSMTKTNETGPKAAVSGIIEDIKGKAKEAVGAATGEADLRKEGRAQQDKASAQRDVAAKEAEADASRAKVAAHEAAERAHQR
jgi:uncharacterized protein YjbJ (UPF0337 family)